ESAKSKTQSEFRLQTLTGDIAYLNGPSEEMSVLVPATVVYKDDMIDQLLNQSLYPEWRGQRHRMIEEWPENMDLWEEYYEIYRSDLRTGAKDKWARAKQFYLDNFEAMNKGARVSWEHRKSKHEIDALQHAMNLYFRNKTAFASEAQNEPEYDHYIDEIMCPVDVICSRQSGFPAGELPDFVETLVAFIDVQKSGFLWYGIAGASEDFQAAIIEYGTYPKQGRLYFSKADSLRLFKHMYQDLDRTDAMIARGVGELLEELGSREFLLPDGTPLRIQRINVDEGAEQSAVYNACRSSIYASICMPTKGVGVGAGDTPFSQRKKKRGEKIGQEWHIKPSANDRKVLHALVDANYWKSQVHKAFLASPGATGSLVLPSVSSNSRHRLFGDHHHNEEPDEVTSSRTGRTVTEWTHLPGDQDYFDVSYNLMAALTMEGCVYAPAHAETYAGRTNQRHWK
ncbi:MAG: terminase gpA endonuclease subunit, partial [Rubripirellula sp.]